jgi:hypothetical protein
MLAQHHLQTQGHSVREEYGIATARVIAMTICHIADLLLNPKSKTAHQFVLSYSLMKGLKKFDQRGREAAYKEMKQLHNQVVFKPIKIAELTEQEKRQAMESTFLGRKEGWHN